MMLHNISHRRINEEPSVLEGNILIVDDDPLNLELLHNYFLIEGFFNIELAENVESARAILCAHDIDVILLDIKMPGQDGLTFARQLRSVSDIGIIFVTSKIDDIDKIVGLEVGADDYIVKPFNEKELLSRTKCLLRRVKQLPSISHAITESSTTAGNCIFDSQRRLFRTISGTVIDLTEKEFKFLGALINHDCKVVNRNKLSELVLNRGWDPSERTIDILVSNLRKKLRNHANLKIKTVHGVGYKLEYDRDQIAASSST